MIVAPGIPADQTDAAAALYWQAFRTKLRVAMGPDRKALTFITRVLRPDHAISATADDGTLLGVVGFKTHEGALVGGTFADLRAIYGLWGSSWRAVILSLLERDVENERFLMDGIFVAEAARGQGVGTALLDAVSDEARTRGHTEIRLDVIDTNPRARALYERKGFTPIKTDHLGPLKHLFGFQSSTTMIKPL